MRRTRFGVFGFALAVLTSTAAAQYDLSWYTIDGGGGMFSAGGAFEVSGTIGQFDAGVMSGGIYELQGGFWPGATAPAPCLGDLNGDGAVSLADLSILLANYGTVGGVDPEDGDLDGDDDVDLTDLSLMLSVFGTFC